MRFPDTFEVLIITLSDRASKGEYEDLSGPQVKEMLSGFFNQLAWKHQIENIIIPDDETKLRQILKTHINKKDLIISTGGTGIGPRDITPDVVKEYLEKEITGIMELIRVKYGMEKPNALLSRGIAGCTGKSLIYSLPGSLKAVKEYMTEILKTLEHSYYMLYGLDKH